MSVAFVFPGQGSQADRHDGRLRRRIRSVRATFAEASEVLGRGPVGARRSTGPPTGST